MSPNRIRRTLEVQGWPYWLFERLLLFFGIYFVALILPDLLFGRDVTLTSPWPAIGFAVGLTACVALFAYQDRKAERGGPQAPRGD